MHNLSEKQIAKVSNKLKEQEINYSHLFDDLLDHVCCDIEICMQRGLNYNQASEKIFEEIGLNGLREIQEATIFYVKLNLVIMKKLMNVLAIIGTSVLSIGLIFKLNHWPGGSLLFFFGILLLLLGFFPTALLNIRKEYKLKLFSKQFGVYLISFLTIFVTGAALLFKTMHWPGGSILVLISMVFMLIVFFPILFYQAVKSKQNREAYLSLVIFSFLFIAVLDVQTYNSQTSVFNVIDNVKMEREIDFYKKAIKEEVLTKPDDIKTNGFDTLSQTLSEIETLIANYQETILGDKKSIYLAAKSYLHNSGMNPEFDKGFTSLNKLIRTYQDEALTINVGNKIMTAFISTKLSTETFNVEVFGPLTWQKRNFEGYGGDKLIYTNLNRILRDIYQIHYELLRAQNI